MIPFYNAKVNIFLILADFFNINRKSAELYALRTKSGASDGT